MTKFKTLSFLLVLCFCSMVSATEPIRVMTFNILCSKPDWEVNKRPWELRKPVALEVMLQYPDGNGPYDFIGTQETSINPDHPELNQVDQLANEMTGYGSLATPCGGDPKKFSLTNMIFWKKDRWEIDKTDSGTFWLSGMPDVPGSNDWVEKNKGGERNVTYGLFHELGTNGRTGKKVYFFNTHLNVFVEEARIKSALLIMERIENRKEKDAAVIVTGDFNSLQNVPIIAYMQGASFEFDGKTFKPPMALTETFKAVHPNSTNFGTVHDYKGNISKDKKIDFIFASDLLKPIAAKVILTTKNGVYPSDHLPVDAVLEWK